MFKGSTVVQMPLCECPRATQQRLLRTNPRSTDPVGILIYIPTKHAASSARASGLVRLL